MTVIRRFLKYPFFVQLLVLLCSVGVATNLVLLLRDLFFQQPILWRLHVGFLMLYTAQVWLILAPEKYVCLLTVLQGIMALLTTADFIFTPLLQIAGLLYHGLFSPTVEQLKIYQYIFVSAAFTLQMASAAYLWGYLKSIQPRPQ